MLEIGQSLLKSLTMTHIDAKACFNRILVNCANLVHKQQGLAEAITKRHEQTLAQA